MPDLSIFTQIAIFIAVWLGLRALVFEPIHRMLAERDRRTVQSQHSAEALIAAAHADRARYEEALRERRLQMAQEAEAARHAAIEASNGEIAAARAAIARELAVHRGTVASQVEAARRALGAEAEGVAVEMLRRVSGGTLA